MGTTKNGALGRRSLLEQVFQTALACNCLTALAPEVFRKEPALVGSLGNGISMPIAWLVAR